MINRKVDELKIAIKRFVTRLMVLAAIIVFGAIAIAQAQREREPGPQAITEVQPLDRVEGELGTPIQNTEPLSVTAASFDEPAGDYNDPQSIGSVDETDLGYPQDNLQGDLGTDLPSDNYSDSYADRDYVGEATETVADVDASLEYNDEQAPPLLEETGDLSTDVDVVNQDRRNPYRDEVANDVPVEEEASLDQEPLEDTLADDFPADETEPQLPGFESEQTNSAIDQDNGQIQQEYQPRETQPQQLAPVNDRYQTQPAPRSVSNPGRIDRSSQGFDRAEQIEDRVMPQYELARRSSLRSSGAATGKPGPQTLEGPQSPSITVEKIAPPEIQVGKPARFQIKIRNVGNIPADNVLVRDEVPEGTKLIDTTPHAAATNDGVLMWDVGTINPGDESVVSVQIMPVTEGQVGSVATVSFQASATARTQSTKPSLVVEHTCPRTVMLGDTVKFAIKLTNPGSGTATQVVLDEIVPPGLSHSSGNKLEYEVGTINPNQTRHLELSLKAARPGKVINKIVARGDAGLVAEDTIELEVVAPKLDVGITGPNRRYLEREATFTVTVANPGSAPAKNVELVAKLPRGLKFLNTNNSGHYDQARHAVIWSLEQLPAGEMGKAQFRAIPVEMGEYGLRAEASALRGLTAHKEHKLMVEGIAALYFGVVDQIDPVEVGGKTTYLISVENQGSKTATNIQFTAMVPNGMKPIAGEGATTATIRGQQITFDPIERLGPKAKTSYRVIVQGVTAGDQKLRVQMTSDDTGSPVMKEESTRVYTD